ncbi:hypothetical protein A2Y85_06180 [candidate division WOR-3 bacterium RBG_13_43_14]|uniref:Transcription regulator TrmB N-terminal domain-containing protein n=1 Tax=candidate division WOR-3 bacterium RBG_13_43_14 TaxID=1802590 RepID=A0A1F4UD71_UNCW3|nr:MAG: hypothetical protein A2Y85_06180 [candidate division WOR-3 bacterium RBG_13_43_14]
MTNKEDAIAKMMKLGISEGEAKVFTAILEYGQLSAMEIHERTKVPRSKVYEITQKMVLRGMCIEKSIGSKKKYQAVEPARAFQNIINEYENEFDERKQLAAQLVKAAVPVYQESIKNTAGTEYVEIIRDLQSIHECYVGLVKITKREIISFVKPPYSTQRRRDKLNEQESAEFEVLKKGVIVRTLYEIPDPNEFEINYTHIHKCVMAGERARVIEKLPIKMYVFDNHYVLMALANIHTTTSPLTMLVVEHPALALASQILFNHLWEHAYDYQILRSLNKKPKKK